MISVAEIEARLRDRVEALARELLPNARREGPYLKIGSIDGEPGQSMVIYLQGAKQGRWSDFAGSGGDAAGDMLDLIAATKGLHEKRDAVAWAKDWLGIVDAWSPRDAVRPSAAEMARRAADARARAEARAADDARDKAAKIRGAKALFLNAAAVPVKDTPAEWYLRGRGLLPDAGGAWPGALRYHPEVWNREAGVKIPAMLAAIYLANGEQVATHRTFLQNCPRRGWTKIDSPNAKMVLGPMWGGFVPVSKGASGKSMRHIAAGEPVYMAEGIEDCLTIRMVKPEARVIAAISLGNMAAVVLPEAARELIIVADRDDNVKAVDTLERAIATQQARGMTVKLVMPPRGVKDLNEWLVRSRAGAGAAA